MVLMRINKVLQANRCEEKLGDHRKLQSCQECLSTGWGNERSDPSSKCQSGKDSKESRPSCCEKLQFDHQNQLSGARSSAPAMEISEERKNVIYWGKPDSLCMAQLANVIIVIHRVSVMSVM